MVLFDTFFSYKNKTLVFDITLHQINHCSAYITHIHITTSAICIKGMPFQPKSISKLLPSFLFEAPKITPGLTIMVSETLFACQTDFFSAKNLLCAYKVCIFAHPKRIFIDKFTTVSTSIPATELT